MIQQKRRFEVKKYFDNNYTSIKPAVTFIEKLFYDPTVSDVSLKYKHYLRINYNGFGHKIKGSYVRTKKEV